MTEKNNKPEGPRESPMSGKIDYDEIRKLIALLEEKGLSVFELEVEGLKVKIGRNAPAPVPATIVQAVPPAPAGVEAAGTAGAAMTAGAGAGTVRPILTFRPSTSSSKTERFFSSRRATSLRISS